MEPQIPPPWCLSQTVPVLPEMTVLSLALSLSTDSLLFCLSERWKLSCEKPSTSSSTFMHAVPTSLPSPDAAWPLCLSYHSRPSFCSLSFTSACGIFILSSPLSSSLLPTGLFQPLKVSHTLFLLQAALFLLPPFHLPTSLQSRLSTIPSIHSSAHCTLASISIVALVHTLQA